LINEELTRTYLPHLRTQFEQGRPILFTGAGFSCAAKNVLGEDLPAGRGLKEKLWPICFPGIDFDPDTSLQDLYQYAAKRHRAALSELLTKTFSVSETGFHYGIGRTLLCHGPESIRSTLTTWILSRHVLSTCPAKSALCQRPMQTAG
jgi:hypothetical protein